MAVLPVFHDFAVMAFAIPMLNDLLNQTNFNHLVLNLLLWKSIVSPTLLINLSETLEVTFLVLIELKKLNRTLNLNIG